MKLTDFLGREYGPGDLVFYAAMSGRCPNIVLGRVVDIYRVWHNSYYVGERYGWERLADDDPVPHHFAHDGTDLGECKYGYRVKVQPIRGARWTQHHDKTYWTDSRSGKRIDPTRSKKYVAVPSHFEFTDGTTYDYDLEKLTWQQGEGRHSRITFEGHFRRTYNINYGPVGTHRFPLEGWAKDARQLWWVSDQYHPWVEEHKEGPKPVTLEITDNIVKWEGELPDGEVPVQVQ